MPDWIFGQGRKPQPNEKGYGWYGYGEPQSGEYRTVDERLEQIEITLRDIIRKLNLILSDH